tara:strand:- start:132 stop:278 length:147 start_codon:yes stop_codon:yes gene_type:complete
MIYTMSTRTGSIVTKKQANSLEEAIEHFSKIKQLPKKEFLKIFVVKKN